jgi:chromosomal replication initiator protein
LTTSEREVVAALGEAIARRIGEPRYNRWFATNTKFSWDGESLLVGVPNRFYLEWLQKTFADDVAAAARGVLGTPAPVRFAIDPELFQVARREEEAERTAQTQDAATRPAPAALERRTAGEERPPGAMPAPPAEEAPRAAQRKRRWRHLDQFVIGPCNRVAHAAACSAVEAPGQDANPLVLHGPVGTGKTHLLEGVYVGLRRRHPEARVCILTAEEFTNRFVQAMRLGKLSGFRKHFREADALLLDDLHFLATKRATQEEFLHTFDALLADDRQIVVTCDCHPRLADQFMPELADRLLGAAVWGLTPPDEQTRRDILRARSLRPGQPPVPEPVLAFVAERLRGNVRELEGGMRSLEHYSRVTGRRVDLELAREALGELLRHAVRVLQLEDVERAVCRVLRLDADALRARERSWQHAHPRMLAMYLARKHTAATYSEVGRYFGGRNHSTAVAGEKKVRVWLQKDEVWPQLDPPVRVRELIERIERELLR